MPSTPKPKLDQRRWEYQFVRVPASDQGTATLSKLGVEGWRVAHVTPADQGAVHALLERSIPEGASRVAGS